MHIRLLTLSALVLASTSALAAFTGDYAPANWTAGTQTFGCGSSTVNTAGMPNTLVLQTLTGCANIGASYSLTNPIPATGTISFNWSYTGNAGAHNSTYNLNGTVTTLASGIAATSGTVTLPVTLGQTFVFGLAGGTNASLTVTNFNFAVPAATSVPTLDFWAKMGLSALLAGTALVALRRRNQKRD